MKSYITTPIYYVNGSPHIGHAFTSVMADILKRNRQALGYDVMLSTGVDEHGQKNQEAAADLGMGYQEFLDMRGEEFRSVFDLVGISYDYFVRTSREGHKQAVAGMEQTIFDKDLIVKKNYTGIYCKGCEEFKKESDLTEDGQCPLHPTMQVEQTEETNYFLKMEPFRERLLQHIADNPDFVQPEAFRNELKDTLSQARARGAQPKSCWQLNGAGAVGGQVLTGIPTVARLRGALDGAAQVWPFETGLAAPDAAVVFAEIYPSLVPLDPAPEEVKDAAQVCATAAHFAADVLRPGGVFLAKTLQGGSDRDLLTFLKRNWREVRHIKPPASRKDSAEMFVLALGFRGAPEADEDA